MENKSIFIALQIIVLLVSVILHEIAHGLAAKKLGDPTASDAGRLTLNPIKHIDPYWTILIPLILIAAHSPFVIGGAKPVPVDPRYFKDPKRDMMWTALAGPATNIALALLAWGCLYFFSLESVQAFVPGIVLGIIALAGALAIIINVMLAVFNLIPVPPLDGGRILVGLLPWKAAVKYAKIERYGILIIFALLYFHILDPIFSFFYSMISGALEIL